MWVLVQQYQRFGKAPEPVSVDQAAPVENALGLGPWVTLQGELKLQCGSVIQWRHDPPESWFFGKVASSYIPAFNAAGDRFYLLLFHGDVNCESMPKGPLSGVLIGVNSRLRSTLQDEGFGFPQTKVPPMVLDVSANPTQMKKYLAFCVGFQIMSLWLAGRFWKKYRAKQKVVQNGAFLGTQS